jgi:hypothetical protein
MEVKISADYEKLVNALKRYESTGKVSTKTIKKKSGLDVLTTDGWERVRDQVVSTTNWRLDRRGFVLKKE